MSTALDILRTTFKEWNEDKAPRLAAALSYYAIFSIAPLLIIVIAVAGFVIDPAQAREAIVTQVGDLVGPAGAELLIQMVDNASQRSSGIIATVVGVALLIFGATGLFIQLQDALNTIWDVAPRPDQGLAHTLRSRLLSFAMVLVIGLLLLLSLVVSAALTVLNRYLSGALPGADLVWQAVNIVVSLAIVTLLFAAIYKVLPDVEIRWREVWVGAFVTALLFTVGKYLIGLYLGRSSTASVYGAAGSLVVILLWIYYSSLIIFFGAELTQVYARRRGERIVPSAGAIALSPEARAAQGIPRREQQQAAAADEPRAQPAGGAPEPASARAGMLAGFLAGLWTGRKGRKDDRGGV